MRVGELRIRLDGLLIGLSGIRVGRVIAVELAAPLKPPGGQSLRLVAPGRGAASLQPCDISIGFGALQLEQELTVRLHQDPVVAHHEAGRSLPQAQDRKRLEIRNPLAHGLHTAPNAAQRNAALQQPDDRADGNQVAKTKRRFRIRREAGANQGRALPVAQAPARDTTDAGGVAEGVRVHRGRAYIRRCASQGLCSEIRAPTTCAHNAKTRTTRRLRPSMHRERGVEPIRKAA
jgi:hypothetical protein